MKIINVLSLVGTFAENKDIARDIRKTKIVPALEKKEDVTLDFKGVTGATQSFVHALISEIIRTEGPESLDHIYFKNCNETIQKIITIVTEYMQEAERNN